MTLSGGEVVDTGGSGDGDDVIDGGGGNNPPVGGGGNNPPVSGGGDNPPSAGGGGNGDEGNNDSVLTATQVQQLYIACFGRPGDPSGIDYWLSSGITEREFADNIYAQEEYASTVGTLSIETQVNELYKNLFARDADVDGLLYWTAQIENGTSSLSSIALDLIHAVSNPSDANSADAAVLANKVAAAEAFTADIKTSTDAILAYQPESTSPWESGAAYESAKSFITSITTVAHTDAEIDAAVELSLIHISEPRRPY